ncbi:MAG: molybdate ABC transporter substrate-binding protein [Nitrospirota bacterium]
MTIKKILISVLAVTFWILFTVHTGISADRQELTISAAISLKNAFEEIGKLFEGKYKGVKVIFNFGASGDLVRQIEGGAPVDVFVSAAQKDMDEAEKMGLILPDSRVNFAGNSIVLVIPANSKIRIRTFQDLGLNQTGKIAAGNPKTVPAGRYAEEVFVHFRLLTSIKEKFVYAEHVRQVLDYVARGEVDAGVVYSTDAMIRAKDIRIVATASENSHRPVIYPAAVVKGTNKESLSKAFVSFLVSEEGRKVLEKHGFKMTEKR